MESFLSVALKPSGLSAFAIEQTTSRHAAAPLPPWYFLVSINKSSCLVAPICPARGPFLRTSSSTFMSPATQLDDHAAPCVYPSGVCTTCWNADQLRMSRRPRPLRNWNERFVGVFRSMPPNSPVGFGTG